MNILELSEAIKNKAIEIGFDKCGIAKSNSLLKEKEYLEQWLSNGYNGSMSFLSNDTNKRTNPDLLFNNCKSVIVCLLNYRLSENPAHISMYAAGHDYHQVVLSKLNKLIEEIKKTYNVFNGKAYCDTSPILEKAWAVKAGLGVQGKNTLLLNNDLGSFFFIGIILCSNKLNYDKEINENFCKNCNYCIKACPTKAINSKGFLEANKCLSYITIESKKDIPDEYKGLIKTKFYGCDICQLVCPINDKNKKVISKDFKYEAHSKLSINEWLNISEKDYKEICKNTVFERLKYNKLKSLLNS